MLALYVLLPWEPQRVAWRVTSVEFLSEMREISGHLNTKPCSNPTQTENITFIYYCYNPSYEHNFAIQMHAYKQKIVYHQ